MNSIIDKEISIKDFIPINIIPKQGPKKKLELFETACSLILKSKRNKKLTIKKTIILNKEDLISIGLYFAEGIKYVNKDRRYNHSGEIGFSNSEIIAVSKVIKLFEKFGIKRNKLRFRLDLNYNYRNNKKKAIYYWTNNLRLDSKNKRPRWLYLTGKKNSIRRRPSNKLGCINIYYSSVILRNVFLNFIYDIFDLCIKYKLKEELSLILKGFFAGDGNVDYSVKFNRKQVEFTIHDLNLMNKIRRSLEILGLRSIKETWPEKTKTHSKALRIYNKNDFEILNKYKIPFLLSYKKEKFIKIINSY